MPSPVNKRLLHAFCQLSCQRLFTRIAIILMVIAGLNNNVSAQKFDSLSLLSGNKVKVYYSTGSAERAASIAKRCDNVIAYFKPRLGVEPAMNILVLAPADWSKFCAKGAVYGMPHYSDSATLVVAAEDNPFWKSMVPPLDKLPLQLADTIRKTYTTKEGNITMQAFFDLLAIHELGHAYHNQNKVKMQRRWMGELFPNILLHTYIAENEPALLPALTVFPQLMISGGSNGMTYTTLKDFEEKYNDIATKAPRNYAWYQCRLHATAATIYDKAGKDAIIKLWKALKSQNAVLNDEDFSKLLSQNTDPAIADVQLQW